MADVILKMIADSEPAVKEFGAIENSMQRLQVEAERTNRAAEQIIPPETGLQKLDHDAIQVSTSMGLARDSMQGLGIYSSQTTSILRTLRDTKMQLNAAGVQNVSTLQALSYGMKAFYASMGPVGMAIIAINAAMQIGRRIYDRHNEAQERAAEFSKEQADRLRDLEVRYMALHDPLRARVEELKDAHREEMQSADEWYEHQKQTLADTLREESRAARKFFASFEERQRGREEAFERHSERMLELEEEYNEQVRQIRAVNQQQIEDAREQHTETVEDTAEDEARLMREKAEEIMEALREEQATLGMSEDALLRRQMITLGMSEAEADRAAELQRNIRLEQQKIEMEQQAEETLESYARHIAIATAELEGNNEELREQLILKKMDAGYTREQAETIFEKKEALEDLEAQIAEANNETKEAIELEEKLHQAQRVGLEDLHDRIAMAARADREEPEISGVEIPTGGSQPMVAQRRGDKSTEILERIYTLMEEVKSGLPLVGALG